MGTCHSNVFYENIYYEYVYSVYEDAETEEEVFDKAYKMTEVTNSSELNYVGYSGGNGYKVAVNGLFDLDSLKQID